MTLTTQWFVGWADRAMAHCLNNPHALDAYMVRESEHVALEGSDYYVNNVGREGFTGWDAE